jgi:hypothetical protein
LREEADLVFLVEEFFEEELFAELFRTVGWLAELLDDGFTDLPEDAWIAPEDFWAALVDDLEADAPAVEGVRLERLELELFDAVGDAECLAGWLSLEEVEATMALDFV